MRRAGRAFSKKHLRFLTGRSALLMPLGLGTELPRTDALRAGDSELEFCGDCVAVMTG